MLGGDSLYNYFANNSRANIRKYDNIKDMLNDKNSDLIVLDREVYIIIKINLKIIIFYILIR